MIPTQPKRGHRLGLSGSHRSPHSLAELMHGTPRPRAYGPHNRGTPRISAACERNQHSECYSLNCSCICNHGWCGK